MYKNSRNDQRSEHIRCILCNKEQSVQKIPEQDQHKNTSENPKFLTDNGKDHIVLSLRNASQFLDTVSKSPSEKATGADRIQCLYIRLHRNISQAEAIPVLA